MASYLSFPLCVLLHLRACAWADTVLIVSNPPTAVAIGIVVKRLFKKRVCFILQDLYPDLAVHLGSIAGRSFFVRTMRRLNTVGFRVLDHIVVLGEDMRSYLLKHYQIDSHKLSLITNWGDMKRIVTLAKDNPW